MELEHSFEDCSCGRTLAIRLTRGASFPEFSWEGRVSWYHGEHEGRVWWKFLFFPRVGGIVVTSTRFESRSANCNPFRNFHTPRNTRNRYYVISTVFIPRNYGVSFFLLALNSPINESNRRFFFFRSFIIFFCLPSI